MGKMSSINYNAGRHPWIKLNSSGRQIPGYGFLVLYQGGAKYPRHDDNRE
jgi:hypothetical protein